jgi:hypothetical protein
LFQQDGGNRGIRLLNFRDRATRRFTEVSAGIAQLVEQLICNQQVVGSNPTAGSLVNRGISMAGENLLGHFSISNSLIPGIAGVVRVRAIQAGHAGSIPVARSFTYGKRLS